MVEQDRLAEHSVVGQEAGLLASRKWERSGFRGRV